MRIKTLMLLLSLFMVGTCLAVSESAIFAYDAMYEFGENDCTPNVFSIESYTLENSEEVVENPPEKSNDVEEVVLKDCETILAFVEGGKTSNIDFESYLIGVVMSEIPYTFEYEAIKAQAVATRTYALRELQSGQRHTVNTLCDDPSHCSAYLSKKEYVAKYGEDAYLKAYEIVKKAVNDTDSEVITYDGELCCAVYHASSHQATENSYNLWGTETPYLKSVSTSEKTTRESIAVNKDRMYEYLISVGSPCADYSDIVIKYNDSGRCDTVTIAGVTVEAKKLRNVFGLKSCDFDVKYENESYRFTSYGYGHGIGMSQNGANSMAKEGNSYKEILLHYYTGVELSKLN